ncbi:MAG: hypothetical protein WA172_00405 [Terriglobales bacterium]
MKTSCRLLRTVEFTILMVLCTIPLASAKARFGSPGISSRFQISQARVQAHVANARHQALSADDVSTFQTNFQSLVTYLGQAPTTNPNQQALINDLQTQVNGMTPDEISQMASSVDVNAFNTAVSTLFSTPPGSPVLAPSDPPANLVAPQYGICTPTAGPPQIPSDAATQRALLITIEVLEALDIVADDLANLDIEVIGEGVNIPLVIIAIVADEIVNALQIVIDQLTFCDINVEASQVTSTWQNSIVIDTDIANLNQGVDSSFSAINNQGTSVDTDVDNHIASIAGNTSNQYSQVNNELVALGSNFANQVTGVDLDVDNHVAAANVTLSNSLTSLDVDVKNTTTTIGTGIGNQITQVDNDVLNQATQTNAAIGTFQTLDIRIKIELALAQGLSIESFQLPLADGGYLQTVRAIVADIITKMQADKMTIGTATKWLAQGDTALASNQYVTAYQDYKSAYQAASK